MSTLFIRISLLAVLACPLGPAARADMVAESYEEGDFRLADSRSVADILVDPGDIGPKTYARVFEFLLHLKANHLWPAMHKCTRAFNYYFLSGEEEKKRTGGSGVYYHVSYW